jgi:Asp-tRNA(Asn)/Glu-tRNA(Gln) amidotransferase A subunit family amidase
MADSRLDALVYATFDYPPAVIRSDVLTNPSFTDVADPGNNRRLAPILGFPALSVPAGFTADGLPVGSSFWEDPSPNRRCSKSATPTSKALTTGSRRRPLLS